MYLSLRDIQAEACPPFGGKTNPAAPAPNCGPSVAAVTAPLSHLRVLVVDDEPEYRNVIWHYVQKIGHTCAVAGDADEGLTKYPANPSIL